MRTFFSVVVLLIASVLTTGQTSIREVVNVTSNPTGTSCAPRRLYKNTVNNTIWQRNSVTGQCEQITGGATGAPTDATYITQTANGSLSAEQALNSLSSGIMRVATTTGAITSLTDSAGIAANIADETGTDKLVFNTSPNFTTSLSLGTNPAQSGGVRLPNNTSVSARNAANSSDLSLLNLNGSNVLQLLGGVFVLDTDGNFVTSAQGGMHDINMGGGWWVQRAESTGGTGFGSGHKLCWGSASTNTANPVAGDVCVMRNRPGVVEINNSTAGTAGAIISDRLVVAKTSGYTVVAGDKSTFFTNTGAGAGVTFTLPTPVAGMTFEFYRDANQTVTIDVAAGVTIRIGASVTTDGGNVTLDAVGSRIRLVAISTTQWVGDLSGTATFN